MVRWRKMRGGEKHLFGGGGGGGVIKNGGKGRLKNHKKKSR